MKKYKVLKEFVSCAGNLFTPTTNGDGIIKLKPSDNFFFNKTLLENKFIEEVKPEPTYKPFNPERNEIYWFVDYDTEICNTKYEHICADKWNVKSGNCFRTKEEARYYRDWLIARKRIMDSSDFVPDWEDSNTYNYFVFYSYHDYILKIGSNIGYNQGQAVFHKTEEQAKQAIKDLKNEYLVYFGVKRSLDETK